MTIATIQVILTDDGRWAVESDDAGGERVYCFSRAAAIAAGVQKALEQDGVLMIHGVDDELTELDSMGRDAKRAV
ncbi:DUF2188 domain-containing protein [Cupriavidus sp. D39]|uniref:DUF2188 domain-containing protein n=1 Tax=Cupriavidus sp. D39 TaxID=2997877 RepID=UPI00226FA855|nr:DUF2188 domain-containing protein [Cupriavidus sp. D39]MCY0853327.1 DUF2188 domain-containing protein [Cupriavidus sp. D39]